MGIDRLRRVTFEEVADLYHESRPSYPEELIEDAIRLSRVGGNGRILEIGCGTGNVMGLSFMYGLLCTNEQLVLQALNDPIPLQTVFCHW